MKTPGLTLLALMILVAGCTSMPTGPSTMALPGTGKGFDQFRVDDGACREYAYDAVGGHTAARAQEDAGLRSAAAGVVIGALIGGAVSGGHGAAVGAGVGGAAGGIAGVGAAEGSGYEAQRRYDQGYQQCMYAKGHRVAVNARYSPYAAPPVYYPPPGAARYSYVPPPPPPGYVYPPSPIRVPPPGLVPPPGSAPLPVPR